MSEPIKNQAPKVCYHGDPCLCADVPEDWDDEAEEWLFDQAAKAEVAAERAIEDRYWGTVEEEYQRW